MNLFDRSVDTLFHEFCYRDYHVDEPAEENPEVEGIKESSNQSFLISYSKVESIVSNFFYRTEFV